MTKKLLTLLFLPLISLHAQNPIFDPSMPIVANGSISSPANEGVEKIIDGDIETKFLDFNYWDGMGFTVNTYILTIATGIDITTANDSAERDPMLYEVLGSLDGSTFLQIATGSIPCITDRFFTRSFDFINAIPYQHYRIVLSNQCNTIESMIQVAEVQLTGTTLNVTVPELPTLAVRLYPNPSSEYFHVQTDGTAITSIAIIDGLGSTVKTVRDQADNSRINIADLSSGIYFVKVETAEANVIKKLVVR